MKHTGSIAFVLHAHLPYTRHPEDEFALEHRWLFEAITECYIPLLQVFQQLLQDGVDFRITLSVSPTLAALLSDGWMQSLYIRHIDGLVELAGQEMQRTAGDPDFAPLAAAYRSRFESVRAFYGRYGGDLLRAFRELQEASRLEIIPCGASHAFLPLVQSPGAVRAQIGAAVDSHIRSFGRAPRGLWLPECGYFPGLDAVLREFSIDYFIAGETAFQTAEPAPPFGAYSPVLTPQGVAAFAGDSEATRQVWSSQSGYPGDPDYREYYRDIGFDLDLAAVAPFIHPNGIRVNTGMKYYRVTGAGDEKLPYRPERAAAKAAVHADHFVAECVRRMEQAACGMDRAPLLVAPFDAELFGHWWHEGPQWLEAVLRKLHSGDSGARSTSPDRYLDQHDTHPVCRLPLSSWGRGGYADVWLGEKNNWIYPALHLAEQRMGELADRASRTSAAGGAHTASNAPLPSDGPSLEDRAVCQAGRELMLAQASDWAFMMDAGTTVQYAVRRTQSHVNRFTRLYSMIRAGKIDEEWLSSVESSDAFLPGLDYRLFRTNGLDPQTASPSVHPAATASSPENAHQHDARPLGSGLGSSLNGTKPVPSSEALRILMLSWEYPPLMVGGLSRHVYDLSRYLAARGDEVHVVTAYGGQGAREETVEGVHVHRVDVLQPSGGEFIHWMLAMNRAMISACEHLIERRGLRFDVAHAHDWLVGHAAGELRERYSLPLVATVHATEHGRNNGIHTDLQRKISDIEWKLAYDAQEVIVCSTYMRKELEGVFSLPPAKLHVIANGVDPSLFDSVHERPPANTGNPTPAEPVILFVGRLVREKGVQTLVDAAPSILAAVPGARMVVIGKGPMADELARLARERGVSDRVLFTGFVSDEERNDWLARASVAVFPSLYEPFGIVALEAMAAGIPVVASDVGGLADVVVHDENGRKSIPGDPASLAAEVTAVLRDPSLAARYAREANGGLWKYDWRRIADHTTAVYRDAMDRNLHKDLRKEKDEKAGAIRG